MIAFFSEGFSREARLLITLLVVAAIFVCAPLALAQGGNPGIAPAVFDESMVHGIDLSKVPPFAPRAVGSGTCLNSTCADGTCALCWETCGSCPDTRVKYGCPTAKKWALTFDDGPGNGTSTILDTLKKLNLKATFCMLGGQAVQMPDIVRRVYNEGHEICSHSWSHPHLMSLSDNDIIAEIVQTARTLESIIGVRPKYFRPPYGEFDERVLGIIEAYGHTPLTWNMDTQDYNLILLRQPLSGITKAFSNALTTPTELDPFPDSGFISLQHDIFMQSIALEPGIVRILQRAGYSLSTVAQCLGDPWPYINGTIGEPLAEIASASVMLGGK